MAALRAIPGLRALRPADANETSHAWRAVLQRQHDWFSGPVGLVPDPAGRAGAGGHHRGRVAMGAYILREAEGALQVILLASGSEVEIAVQAREVLQGEGIGTRVVSIPCLNSFQAQDVDYIESVLPPAVTARVSIEAAIAQPWWRGRWRIAQVLHHRPRLPAHAAPRASRRHQVISAGLRDWNRNLIEEFRASAARIRQFAAVV